MRLIEAVNTALAFRADLVADLSHMMRVLAERDFFDRPERLLRRSRLEQMAASEVFLVLPEMQIVVEAAHVSMPRQVLLPGDPPAPYGVMFFPGKPTWNVAWYPVSDGDYGGIVIVPLYVTRGDLLTGKHEISWFFRHVPDRADLTELTSRVLTTWTLMQQRLTSLDKKEGSRRVVDQSKKLRCPTDVVVAQLRRPLQPSRNDATRPVEWSHRWLVSGHWRNQWLPSRQTHRQQWISGYVKGPTDKPLVVKEHVTAWVR